MKTPKKAWKDIAKKLKNRKSTSSAKGTAIEKSRAMPTDVEIACAVFIKQASS
ncbi:MAG: hypothetical protein PG980_000968 [Wolbachia endosymbiont of Ctenocephalides felis wCfeJ]|nr:MAG: hypothetical protein PG980_000968 [Wolbachia endosymbiont of Ctenocephalides felis wCfeJ]